jgi:hypothetical protein
VGLAAEKTSTAMGDLQRNAAAQSMGQPNLASSLAFYAHGIDRSDYVAAVAPKIREMIGQAASLLDVGAGAGQLGAALCGPFARWVALEPNAEMRARLAGLRKPKPTIIKAGWQKLTALNLKPQDISLAANIGAPLTDARGFYRALRPLSRRAMVWIVPAQKGARGMCLAGFLDPEWHGEDMRPGHEITLAGLGAEAPDHIAFADWTFRGLFPSLAHAEAHFLRGLKWNAGDLRIPALRARIASQAQLSPDGVVLESPKKSAILIWDFSS